MNDELCRRTLKAAGLPVGEHEAILCKEENSPGLGYSSLLQRFDISTPDSQEQLKTLSVILKTNPDKEHSSDSLFDKMFSCEIKMFQKVLPIFKEFFEKSKNPIVWPKLYAISDDNRILMEDLKPEFRNSSDVEGTTLDEAFLAVNSLAMFHAASLAAKEKGQINSDTLEPYFYCRRDRSINSFFKDGLRILAKTIKQSWHQKWSELADKFEYFSDNIGEALMKLHLETEERFKVINHGDFWRANLMFKYDEMKKPVSFRCVDFQLSHYGSLAWDLSYFFFVNPNTKLRYDHYDELIASYHATVDRFLSDCGSRAPRPSLDEIRRELDRFRIYGFLKSCTDLPYQCCSFESGIDAENLFKENEETEILKLKLFSAQKYIDIIQVHIDYLKNINII